MPKDIFFSIVGILAIVFCVLGFMRGALVQVFSLLGFALAFLLGPVGGRFVIEQAQAHSNHRFFEDNLGHYLMVMGFGTLVYAATVFVGSKVQKKFLRRKSTLHLVDRVVGAMVGLAKVLLIALLLSNHFQLA